MYAQSETLFFGSEATGQLTLARTVNALSQAQLDAQQMPLQKFASMARAALTSGGRNYVSQLARELGISRPLLHLHLQKLQDAGLVTSQLELSQDGKALNYFEVRRFDFALTPAAIAEAARSLTSKLENSQGRRVE